MKTLAVVCRTLSGSGAVAEVARREIEQLRRAFRVHPMSDQLPADWVEAPATTLSPPEFLWLRRYGHAARELAFAWAARRALARLARAKAIDGLLCHSHSVAAIAGSDVQRRYGLPVAMVTHGDIFDRPAGTYDPWLTRVYRTVTPVAYRCADLVITLSPYMAELAVHHGARPERVVVVPNGVAPEAIGLDPRLCDAEAERSRRARPDGLHLLFVGRLSVEKGLDVLLRALSLLREESIYPSLMVIGAGPLQAELHGLADHLGLGDQVEFHGQVARTDLGAFYRAADAVCVPSRSEPFAGVVLEALVAGTPVVGSCVGGVPSVVRDQENGRLYPADDYAALATVLGELSRDRHALLGLKQNAFSSVWPRFAWDSVGTELSKQLMRIT